MLHATQSRWGRVISLLIVASLIGWSCGSSSTTSSSSTSSNGTTLTVTNENTYQVGGDSNTTQSMSVQSLKTQAVPSTLQCNFYIDLLKCYTDPTDANTASTIISNETNETIVDVLADSAQNGTGVSVSGITPLPEGTYTGCDMTIGDIRFVDPAAGLDDSFIPELTAMGVDVSSVKFRVTPNQAADEVFMLPATIPAGGSASLRLNAFVPESSIAADGDSYAMTQPPLLMINTDASESTIGHITGTVAGGAGITIPEDTNVYVGAFLSDPGEGGGAPVYGVPATEAGANSYTYDMSLPGDLTVYLGAFADLPPASINTSGPGDEDYSGMYGMDPLSEDFTADSVTVTTGATASGKNINVYTSGG